ncbi:Protein of unknown function [Pyronema omphalodes CBS 100304]|uniref:Uncharacterized protein n=1 Tax=Pyronema omphalodes (strain CBS 100304) TaxID=1076935 RepID=U4LF38_PYROM|nr:Protein of unknown function [Pyronema omphalodes CBS 100304]
MVASDPPVLNPTDTYSTTLPQNLQTTDPLISALATYMAGVETMFTNLAQIQGNMEREGYPINGLAFGDSPTKYIAMAIKYGQDRELPISPQEIKDAILIERMNAFLHDAIEATKFVFSHNATGHKQVTLIYVSVTIYIENVYKIIEVIYSEETKGVWVRIFGE